MWRPSLCVIEVEWTSPHLDYPCFWCSPASLPPRSALKVTLSLWLSQAVVVAFSFSAFCQMNRNHEKMREESFLASISPAGQSMLETLRANKAIGLTQGADISPQSHLKNKFSLSLSYLTISHTHTHILPFSGLFVSPRRTIIQWFSTFPRLSFLMVEF